MYCTGHSTYFDATVGGGGDEIGKSEPGGDDPGGETRPALYFDQVHLRPYRQGDVVQHRWGQLLRIASDK